MYFTKQKFLADIRKLHIGQRHFSYPFFPTGSWTKLFSRNETHISPSFNASALVDAIKSGHDVISVCLTGQKIKYNVVATAYVSNMTVCIQTLPHVVFPSGKWRTYLFCTDMLAKEITITAFEPFEYDETSENVKTLDWFVRRSDCVSDVDATDLEAAGQNGQGVLFVEKIESEKRIIRKSPNVLQWAPLALRTKANTLDVESFAGDVFNFSYPLKWIQDEINAFGQTKTILCEVGRNNSCIYETDTDNVRWKAEEKWFKIYSNDRDGQTTFGNLCNFEQKLNTGKRVKVVMNNTSFQPENVLVYNGHVYAMLADDLATADENVVNYVFELVSTLGIIERAFISYSSGDLHISTYHSHVEWYIETTSWNVVVNSSDLTDLSNVHYKIVAGVEFRMLYKGQEIFSVQENASFTFISNVGSIISDTSTFNTYGRLYPFLDVTLSGPTVKFVNNFTATWRILKVQVKRSTSLLYYIRTHGQTELGEESVVRGHILLFTDA